MLHVYLYFHCLNYPVCPTNLPCMGDIYFERGAYGDRDWLTMSHLNGPVRCATANVVIPKRRSSGWCEAGQCPLCCALLVCFFRFYNSLLWTFIACWTSNNQWPIVKSIKSKNLTGQTVSNRGAELLEKQQLLFCSISLFTV